MVALWNYGWYRNWTLASAKGGAKAPLPIALKKLKK